MCSPFLHLGGIKLLFTIKQQMNDGRQVNVVLFAETKTEDGNLVRPQFKALLGKKTAISLIKEYGDNVAVRAIDGFVYPVVPSVGTMGGVLDVTPLYNLMRSNGPTLRDESQQPALIDKLKDKFVGLTLENFQVFIKAYDAWNSYLKGELKLVIEAPETAMEDLEVTRSIVRRHNDKLGPQFEYIKPETNKTHHMVDEFDDFYIALPSYSRMRSEDFPIQSFIPDLHSEVYNPYPHPLYNTPYYKDYFTVSDATRRGMMEVMIEHFNLTKEQKTNVPRLDVKRVEGDPANNDLPIQANEELFYNALREYIRYDITQISPNGDVDQLYKDRVCSPRVFDFLNMLVTRFFSHNWFHNKTIPIKYLNDPEDDDAETSSSDGEEDNKLFWASEDAQIIDGIILLNSYLDEAAKQIGLDAYVEAIIKLARWGTVKPTVLSITGYNRYLDLNEMREQSTSGNISNMQPELIDGYEMELDTVILADKYRDIDYIQSIGVESQRIEIPIGISARRYYGAGIVQMVYLSMLEVRDHYIKHPDSLFIKGLELVNGEIKLMTALDVQESAITLRLVQEKVSTNPDRRHVFYESEVAKRLTLEFSVREMSQLCVFHKTLNSDKQMSSFAERLAFDSKEELFKKMEVNPMPKELFLNVNVAAQIMPVLLKANERFEFSGADLTNSNQYIDTAFRCYDEAAKSLKFTDEMAKWDAKKNTANALSAMMSFGGAAKATPTEVPEESKAEPVTTPVATSVERTPSTTELPEVTLDVEPFTPVSFSAGDVRLLIMESPASAQWYALIDDEGNPDGAFSVVPHGEKKLYLLAGPKDVGDFTKLQRTKNKLDTVLVLALNALSHGVKGTIEDSQLRFTNGEALDFYYTKLNARLKSAKK